MILCTAFVACQQYEEEPANPSFVLTVEEKDAIDTFVAVPEEGKPWKKGENGSWIESKWDEAICVIAKQTSKEDSHFINCLWDGYWARNDSVMAPATAHYDISTDDSSLFRIQIQCLNEEQGLCTVKFTSGFIADKDRVKYGSWQIQIGRGFNRMQDGVDCYLDEVYYTADITIHE